MLSVANIGSTTLRYVLRRSAGPLLVLIHEMGGRLESWDTVLPLLDADLSVLAYDTRGAGLSGPLHAPLTFGEMADDLRRLLDQVAPDEPVILAGCAVGAGIALQFAADFPDRVRGIVAMAPATGILAERREGAEAFVAAVEVEGMAARVETAVTRSFPEALGLPDQVQADYRAAWLENDPASFAQIYRMLIHSTLDDRLGEIKAPTLAIAGELDASRPLEVVAKVADAIPGATLTSIRSGHFMPVQAPEAVAQQLNLFCHQIASAS